MAIGALVLALPAAGRGLESVTVPPFGTVPLQTTFDEDAKYQIVYSGVVQLISTENPDPPAKKPSPIVIDGLFYDAASCSKASKLETVTLIDSRGAFFSPHAKYKNLRCSASHTYTLYANDRPPPVRELVGKVRAKSNLSPTSGRTAEGGITITVTPQKEVIAKFALRQDGQGDPDPGSVTPEDVAHSSGKGTIFSDGTGSGSISHVDDRTLRPDASVELKVVSRASSVTREGSTKVLDLSVVVVKAAPTLSCAAGRKGTVTLRDGPIGTARDAGGHTKNIAFDRIDIFVCKHRHVFGNSFEEPNAVSVVLKGSIWSE